MTPCYDDSLEEVPREYELQAPRRGVAPHARDIPADVAQLLLQALRKVGRITCTQQLSCYLTASIEAKNVSLALSVHANRGGVATEIRLSRRQ